jgi:hypothetical protein
MLVLQWSAMRHTSSLIRGLGTEGRRLNVPPAEALASLMRLRHFTAQRLCERARRLNQARGTLHGCVALPCSTHKGRLTPSQPRSFVDDAVTTSPKDPRPTTHSSTSPHTLNRPSPARVASAVACLTAIAASASDCRSGQLA